MREKLASIGDDFWIEDDDGIRAYRVNGKAMRDRDTFVLEDASGHEVAKIQERKLSVRDKVAIERDEPDKRDGPQGAGRNSGEIRDRHRGRLVDLKARGNIVEHEYAIERNGDPSPGSRSSDSGCTTGTGPRRRGEDEALVLAAVVALKSLTDWVHSDALRLRDRPVLKPCKQSSTEKNQA